MVVSKGIKLDVFIILSFLFDLLCLFMYFIGIWVVGLNFFFMTLIWIVYIKYRQMLMNILYIRIYNLLFRASGYYRPWSNSCRLLRV